MLLYKQVKREQTKHLFKKGCKTNGRKEYENRGNKT